MPRHRRRSSPPEADEAPAAPAGAPETGQGSRADQWLVDHGLAPSRSRAQADIKAGCVRCAGVLVTKPGWTVPAGAVLEHSGEGLAYVSRGGLKLAHGLDHFRIDPAGLRVLDVGASTGGFTDVVLRRGAAHVTAIDVGHGQLHETLRCDDRVTSIEGLNARDLSADHLASAPDLIVCDVSFISLTLALPPALTLAAPGARLVALIKPQFEAGRDRVGKGGVVKDVAVRTEVCERITVWLQEQQGWSVAGLVDSPILGPEGNAEFLIAARAPS